MLSSWEFQDAKVYSRATYDPPDFDSGTVVRFYDFTFFKDRDSQKIAHEFKERLTKDKGWSIAFPRVGSYEFRATH